MKKFKYELMLLLVAIFWGISFPAAKYIGYDLDSISYLTLRLFIATVILAVIFRKNLKNITTKMTAFSFIAGANLSIQSFIQVEGLRYTSSGNSAFISSASVIFVPIFSLIFLKKRTEKGFLSGLLTVVVGFLIISGVCSLYPFGFNFTTMNYGDFLNLIVAVMTAVYYIVMGIITQKYDPIAVNVVHMIGATLTMSILWLFYPEKSVVLTNPGTIARLLFCAIFGSAIGFFLLTKAQAKVSASKVSLICSLESVFALLFAAIVPGRNGSIEPITLNAAIGGLLILIGVIKVSLLGKDKT